MSEQAICTCKIEYQGSCAEPQHLIKKCPLCQRAPELLAENERLGADLLGATAENGEMHQLLDVSEAERVELLRQRDAERAVLHKQAELLMETIGERDALRAVHVTMLEALIQASQCEALQNWGCGQSLPLEMVRAAISEAGKLQEKTT